jgi:hypothetical protein
MKIHIVNIFERKFRNENRKIQGRNVNFGRDNKVKI